MGQNCRCIIKLSAAGNLGVAKKQTSPTSTPLLDLPYQTLPLSVCLSLSRTYTGVDGYHWGCLGVHFCTGGWGGARHVVGQWEYIDSLLKEKKPSRRRTLQKVMRVLQSLFDFTQAT